MEGDPAAVSTFFTVNNFLRRCVLQASINIQIANRNSTNNIDDDATIQYRYVIIYVLNDIQLFWVLTM